MAATTLDSRRANALMAELRLAFQAAKKDPKQWVLVERLSSSLSTRAARLAESTIRDIGIEPGDRRVETGGLLGSLRL